MIALLQNLLASVAENGYPKLGQ